VAVRVERLAPCLPARLAEIGFVGEDQRGASPLGPSPADAEYVHRQFRKRANRALAQAGPSAAVSPKTGAGGGRHEIYSRTVRTARMRQHPAHRQNGFAASRVASLRETPMSLSR